MAGVYSTRFVLFGSGFGTKVYAVPQGKRAIVKGVTAYNNSDVTASVTMVTAGISTWTASVPGRQGATQSGLMIVLNAGEILEFTTTSQAMAATASGFLLDMT